MNKQELQKLVDKLPDDATGIIIGGRGSRMSFTTQQPHNVPLGIFRSTTNVYNSPLYDRADMKGFRFIQHPTWTQRALRAMSKGAKS